MTLAKQDMAKRHRLIKLVHVRKKETNLDDDTYRALLIRETGKNSAAHLTLEELNQVCDVLAGNRKCTKRPEEMKARALWHSAWHLGLLTRNDEHAFRAFVKRQTGVDSTSWVRADWLVVIEALKSWLARAGGVHWDAKFPKPINGQMQMVVMSPRDAVVLAQWRKLADLGAVRIKDRAALDAWLSNAGYSSHVTSVHLLSDEKLDQAIRELGEWLRRVQVERDESDD
jgi:hypothetical protein